MKSIVVLLEAASDIEQAMDFYDAIENGIGYYFREAVTADIRKLGAYFGDHVLHYGFNRSLCSRFHYAIYYRDREDIRQVVGILNLRRSPAWIHAQLYGR